MSRIGKKGIVIPDKTEVKMDSGVISVKGPKGSLERAFRPDVSIVIEGNQISLSIPKQNNQLNALWGTYASHLKNMIKGVNDGFEKKLILEGVGYKSQVVGTKLVLALGFSHQVEVEIPVGLVVKAEKNVVSVNGIDKELVGAFAAKVRDLKKPEPYKGKGFHYSDEVVRRKQGKKSA
jgi:large subunit ribosomal protein L6